MKSINFFLRTQLLNILFVLALAGRFYFIFGFTGMLKPIAGSDIIIFKDIIYFIITAYAIIYFKSDYYNFFKKYASIILIVLAVALVTLILQSTSKTYYNLSWHYIRNIYMYALLIPTTYVLLLNKKINLETIFNSLLLLNLIFSIAQLVWFKEGLLDEQRPLGIVGDPIVSSILNYLLLFKIIFKKLDIYKFAMLVIIFICIDAQASVTAFVSVAIGLLVSATLCYKLYKPVLAKLFFLSILFLTILFSQVQNNDLSDRLLALSAGLASKYLGIRNEYYEGKFKDLSRQRVALYNGDVFANDGDGGVVESTLSFLFGDYTYSEYYRLDSNFISLYKNMGILNLFMYYLILIGLFWLSIKYTSENSHEIAFFIVSVFVLSFFCSTIYKFPLTQLVYLYLGHTLLVKNKYNIQT